MAKIKRKKQHYGNVGHLKTDEHEVTFDNPFYQNQYNDTPSNPKKTTVIVNANSRPILLLHNKGHITGAQFMAADRFFRYWAISQGDANMGIDYQLQKVDGNQLSDPNVIKFIDADKHLQEIKVMLGVIGYNLIERVAGQGTPINQLTHDKRKQNSLADHLRDCLDLMAAHWGYAQNKNDKLSKI